MFFSILTVVRCSDTSLTLQTFRNRRAACEQLLDKALGAQVVAVINAIGTRGISSDEEMPVPSGHGKQFATFDKPWRAQALVSLYRHLDTVHAATRNPNGNPIRTRHHTFRTRENMVVPKELPKDCYNPLYLDHLEPRERHLVRPGPSCGIEELYRRVRTCGLG